MAGVDEQRSVPRWRMVVFWLLAVAVVFLIGGDPERAHLLHGLFTGWAGYAGTELATHEIHAITQSAMVWAVVAAFLVNVRRPREQVGSAWQHGLIPVVWLVAALALGDFPAEVLPIIFAVIAVSILAFVAHPSPMRERFRSAEGLSRPLMGLAVIAAVPFVAYGVGQLRVQLASGPGDPHYEFGHWIATAVFAFVVVGLAALAASRVSGWRLNAWTGGAFAAILGLASIIQSVASSVSTLWGVAAVVWGIAFITVAELEARGALGAARPEIAPSVGAR